jgi:adenosylcobyric acid synthase
MIQGTMSNAGKSIITAGLCRVFSQDGYRVAPFKSQNMALNSYITADGGEMGRAQVVQAEACGLEPTVDMNPILLKPVTDMGSQVIVNGQARGVMTASQYFHSRRALIPDIRAAYDRLAATSDIIVIEGAGSPAEINLKADDIVNMGLAKLIDSPVLLVGDIDRGGVFAQLYGTCALLPPEERARIHGFIINKFRGDVTLLADGLRELEELSGVPTLGVVPYLDVDIDDEDSLSSRLHSTASTSPDQPDIAIIRLPKLSNFTDFTALSASGLVSVRYVDRLTRLGDPDLIIVPGTRNTIADLAWLRRTGLADAIITHARRGQLLIGVCGGYQMLGRAIADPEGVEGGGTVAGLDLLPITTVFQPSKHQTRVAGRILPLAGPLAALGEAQVEGYEIHMGTSTYLDDARPLIRLTDGTMDGCWRDNVAGSYLHGLLDSISARQAVLNMLGADPTTPLGDYTEYRQEQYDRLADALRANLDMKQIYHIMGVR